MLLILPSTASAKVEVNISNNLDGSKNKVNINSDKSTSYQSSENVKNQTDIVIESNGERKEYHGSDGNINLESSDGKSSVKVNTAGTTNNSTQSLSSNITTEISVNSNTGSASPSATPEATVAGIFKDASSETKPGLWEFLKRQLAEIFSLFS